MYKIKIGDDGRAISERHYTSAPNPKYHSNPHDHVIDWHTPREGIPNFGPPINYWDGDAPEFKLYSSCNWSTSMKSIIYDTSTSEDMRFKLSVILRPASYAAAKLCSVGMPSVMVYLGAAHSIALLYLAVKKKDGAIPLTKCCTIR